MNWREIEKQAIENGVPSMDVHHIISLIRKQVTEERVTVVEKYVDGSVMLRLPGGQPFTTNLPNGEVGDQYLLSYFLEKR